MTTGYFPFEDDAEDDQEGHPDDNLDDGAGDDEDWYGIEDEIASLLRPRWLHPDCLNVCAALELGTCCKYPDNPLVRVAVELADSVDATLRRFAAAGDGGDSGPGSATGGCAATAAELAGLLKSVPGLLAQVHAILPRLNATAVAQLLCPTGRLAGAVEQACAYSCPWACHDPGVPGRRGDFEPLLPLLGECSDAIGAALGRRRR